MKKYLLLIFMVPLLLGWKVGGMDSPAKVGGMAPSKIGGMTVCNCTGSYMFCYDGEHVTDNDTAYAISGDLAGTVTGATIHGDYAYCGNYGVLLDATLEQITWPVVDGTDIDASQGTITLYVKTPASYANNTILVLWYSDPDTRLYCQIKSSGYLGMVHQANSSTLVSVTGADLVPTSQWNTLKFSWSVSSNQIAVKVNNNDWDTDADADIVTDFANSSPFEIGSDDGGIDIMNIDTCTITSGYKD